ncbi:phage tail tube protein [Enterococcus faecium]|uniref:phage tail tube protein n=1 Tax=Enterococcus faecium TaxID=1352 RepID=UPI0018ABD862|nr:phage tail protein [Enterococcus faecium]
MRRKKVALIGFEIQELTNGRLTEANWVRLKKIKTVSDSSQEDVDDGDGFLDGSGDPEQTITSHRLGYSFSGEFFEGDEASEIIDGMIGKVGDDRKIGFRVTDDRDNPTKKREGIATISSPQTRTGGATEFGNIEFTILFDSTPEWQNITTTPPATQKKKQD